jgi:preprotein translocase subunit SecA
MMHENNFLNMMMLQMINAKVVYELRDELMSKDDVKDRYETIRAEVISDLFAQHISTQVLEDDWDVEGLSKALVDSYEVDIPIQRMIDEGVDVDVMLEMIQSGFATLMMQKKS